MLGKWWGLFAGSAGVIYVQHAFITGPNGVDIRNLGADIYPYTYTRGSGINSAGQVAGDQNSDPFSSAFITGKDGTGVTYLESLSDQTFTFDYAFGVNEAGTGYR